MKAQVITAFGGPDVFQMIDRPKPTLLPGHALIKVLATSVNPIDCKIRSGSLPQFAPEFPAILHGDGVGVVEEISSEITHIKAGDHVYGYAGGVRGASGALAEFMLVDAKLLVKKPAALSINETAALPLIALTAWEALFHKAKLQENQTVLIHGGVGGVGHIAVQLAKWAKAKVYATVLSEKDFALAKSLGADEVINAKEETVEQYMQRLTNNQGFDVIFDTVGGANLDRSLQAAAINGNVVTTVARSTHDLTPLHHKGLSLHGIFLINPLFTPQGRARFGETLTTVAKIVDAGKLKPLCDPHLFTFDQITQAHAFLESGQARGKVVVRVGEV